MHCQRVDKRTLMNREAGVRQVIELVERKILTEIDGRDQARCLAMEEENVWEAHTVSNGDGAMYCGLKHLYADFNKRSFIGLVKDKVREATELFPWQRARVGEGGRDRP